MSKYTPPKQFPSADPFNKSVTLTRLGRIFVPGLTIIFFGLASIWGLSNITQR